MSSTTSLVPPRRLGMLLRQARISAGRELTDLVADTALTAADLDDVENGRRPLDELALEELLRLYGVHDSGLVPERSQLVIDLDEGRIAVARADEEEAATHGVRADVKVAATHGARADVKVAATHGADAVLARYLALVYRLRDLPVGTGLELRDVDLDVLSAALSLDAGDIENRLRRLMREETEVEADQRRIRRQLLLPLVGVVIAATTIGTLLLVAESDEAPEPSTVATVVDGAPRVADAAVITADTVETDIGNGAAIEVNPDAG